MDFEVSLATVAAQLRQVGRLRDGLARQLAEAQEALRARDRGGYTALDRLTPGIVLVGADGTVLHANAAARALCGTKTGLSLNEGKRLQDHAGGALRAALKDVLADRAGTGASVPLPRPDGGPDLIVLIDRLEDGPAGTPHVVALIVDPARRHVPAPEILSRGFGLTPTEAQTAVLLASGLRPDEIARHMGVSSTTVAFHLRNIFSKTDTNRQTDLVALVLSLALLAPL